MQGCITAAKRRCDVTGQLDRSTWRPGRSSRRDAGSKPPSDAPGTACAFVRTGEPVSETSSGQVHDLVILGGGSGGYAAALRAASSGCPSSSSRRTSSAAPACTAAASRPRRCCTPPRSPTRRARASSSASTRRSTSIDMAGVNKYKDGVVGRLYKGLQGLVGSRDTITYVEAEGRLVAAGHRRGRAGSATPGRNVVLAHRLVRPLAARPRDRRPGHHQRPGPHAGPRAAARRRARRRRHRRRVRQRLEVVRRRGDDRRGAAPAGPGRGRGLLQGARAGLPQARRSTSRPGSGSPAPPRTTAA